MLIFSLLISACETRKTSKSQPEIEKFTDSIVNRAIDSSLIAGGELLVYGKNDTILHKTFGQSNLELKTPMTEEAIYEIASLTKQFTAAAILKLAENGKLNLDDNFTKYMEFDTKGREVKISQLLNHTSGIFQYKLLPGFWEIVQEEHSKEEILELVEEQGFQFEPGTNLRYNDSAYFILGVIIEKVSGMPYQEYLQQEFFEPLGMSNTSYCSNGVQEGKAYGYDFKDGKMKSHLKVDHSWPYSAGSLCSTAEDLLTWTKALHTGKVLSQESYKKLITPGEIQGSPLRYAMGLQRVKKNGVEIIFHNGGIPGYSSHVRYFPEKEVYMIALLNTIGSVSAGDLVNKLHERIFPGIPVQTQEEDYSYQDIKGTYKGFIADSIRKVIVDTIEGGIQLEIPSINQSYNYPDYLGGNRWRDRDFILGYRNDSLFIDDVSFYSVMARE